MTDANRDAVSAIHLSGIATTHAIFETEAPSREALNNNHPPDCRQIIRSDEKVLGRVALSPVSRRPVYSGVVEVSEYVSNGLGK